MVLKQLHVAFDLLVSYKAASSRDLGHFRIAVSAAHWRNKSPRNTTTACQHQHDPPGAMTASNQRRNARTKARDPHGGWLRETRRGRHLSRRLLPRKESTRTRRRTGWALGGDAIPEMHHRRHRRLGACARRWRRVLHRLSTPPARPRRGSQCVSRRSATSASYHRHQWRHRQSRYFRHRRRRRRPR